MVIITRHQFRRALEAGIAAARDLLTVQQKYDLRALGALILLVIVAAVLMLWPTGC